MKDTYCFLGLVILALGIIFGTAAVQQSGAVGWIVSGVLLFVGSLLLTRTLRSGSKKED